MEQNIFDICFANYQIENPWVENKEKTKYFTAEDAALVESAIIVSGDYGLSCKVKRKDKYVSFIPLSRDSRMSQGEVVDLSECKLICLERRGEEPIWRLEEKEL